MRFLLHNEEAVYDATTKVWHYTLDKRISNPTSLMVKKATFSPVSSLTVLPHVIYMHSTALSDMILDKHTVVLRANAHENSTDVIGVLEETHTRGRYALTEREGPFRLSPSSNKRVIDIYFTDGTGAHLAGEIAPGAPPRCRRGGRRYHGGPGLGPRLLARHGIRLPGRLQCPRRHGR